MAPWGMRVVLDKLEVAFYGFSGGMCADEQSSVFPQNRVFSNGFQGGFGVFSNGLWGG